MSTRVMRAAGGSLIMWWLAGAWWLSSDRSLAVAMGALAIGALGTAIAIRGMRQPESRTRDALAALVAAAVGAGLAFVLST
ncbi:MAG: hypothetical protein U0360_10930 [Dehalococcoidia bacterium]